MSDAGYASVVYAAFLISLGATLTLWADYLVRKHFPVRLGKIRETVEGRTFRHERVEVDGREFRNCKFEGVTLVLRGTDLYAFDGNEFIGGFSVDFVEPRLRAALGIYKLAQDLGVPLLMRGGEDDGGDPGR